MRKIRLRVGPGPMLVMISVVGSGCGGVGETLVPPASGGTSGTTSASGGSSSSTLGTSARGGATATTGGVTARTSTVQVGDCSTPPEPYSWADCAAKPTPQSAQFPFSVSPTPQSDQCDVEFVVPVPPEGTPPSPEQLCGASEPSVSAGWAARVTLTGADWDLQGDGYTSVGHVQLAPQLVGAAVTGVEVAVVDADAQLGQVTVGTVVRQGDGFEFPVSFPRSSSRAIRFPRIIIATKISLDCEGRTRVVESTTALYWCGDELAEHAWVSSGDACGECRMICEMAARPVQVAPTQHNEPLGQAVVADVVRIGQYGSVLLLQAQHDGGANRFSYQWDISAGEVLWQDRDLMLWAPPATGGEHLIQVSLLASDAAAVVSTRVRCEALERA